MEQIYTVLDFESTGVVGPHRDEPWQLGVVRLAHGTVVIDHTFESLLRVGDRPFSRHAPGRHAAFAAELARAPRLLELWPTLQPWVAGSPLVAHNAATEKRFLKAAFPLHAKGPWIDTLKLIRVARPELASHKLADVLTALELTDRVAALIPGREPHDALYDAVSCAVLLEYLLQQPAWRDISLAALASARPAAFHRAVATRRRRQV